MPHSDSRSTPAVGIALLDSAKNMGNADPIGHQTTADLVNEVALRAAIKAHQMNGSNGNGKKKLDVGTWVRWSVGLFVLLVGLLWAVSILFAERPTENRVERMIDNTRQHPDSKAELLRHAEQLRIQGLQLNTIETGVNQIDKTLVEIKEDLKRKPPR